MAAAANNNNNNNNTRFNDIYLINDYDPTTFIGPNYTKINDIEIISNRPNEFYVSSFMIYNAYDNNQIIIVIHKPKLLEHNKSSRNILLEIHPTTIELLQSQHLYNTRSHIDKIKDFFTTLKAGKSMAIVFETETEPGQELDYINDLIKKCQDTIYNSKIIVNNSNNNAQIRKKTSTRLAKSSIPGKTRTKLTFNSIENRRSRNNNSAMKKVFISRSTIINLDDPNNTEFYNQGAANREIEDEQSGYMNVNPEEDETFPLKSYQTPIRSRTARNGSTFTHENSMRPLPRLVRMDQPLNINNNGEEVELTPPRTAEPVAIAPAAPVAVIEEWRSTPTPATPTQPA